MAKQYKCSNCGKITTAKTGICSGCKEWNTFVAIEGEVKVKNTGNPYSVLSSTKPILLKDVTAQSVARISSGISEFDRVLGVTGNKEGFVPASVNLVGGKAGVGKSTLLIQVASYVGKNHDTVLYASAEENREQIKARAERLGLSIDGVYVSNETNIQAILDYTTELGAPFLVIDSLNTIYDKSVASSPGNISQLKSCISLIRNYAKTTGTTVFVVSHINANGEISGPEAIEHEVDAVLLFESEERGIFRFLRATKNRYNDTSEVGIFEMMGDGLHSVTNPSERFLAERVLNESGSAIGVLHDGTRSVLLETQSIATEKASSFAARRTIAYARPELEKVASIIIAKINPQISAMDLFVNIAGGYRVQNDKAVDLPVAVSILSSFYDIPTKPLDIFIGELGLMGEIRYVQYLDARIKEATKLGFNRIFTPIIPSKIRLPKNIEIVQMRFLKDVVAEIFKDEE